MIYYGVGNRCAVDLASLNLPMNVEDAVSLLEKKGFCRIDIDLVSLARNVCLHQPYRRGSRLALAPAVFDCSSLPKWLYAQKGIWLPRRSIQQIDLGAVVQDSPESWQAGDLVFITGWVNYYRAVPEQGVGHVGIATGEGTVIHAANKALGVIEQSVQEFLKGSQLRGVRRILPENPLNIQTFITPEGREIETSDDLFWVIVSSKAAC